MELHSSERLFINILIASCGFQSFGVFPLTQILPSSLHNSVTQPFQSLGLSLLESMTTASYEPNHSFIPCTQDLSRVLPAASALPTNILLLFTQSWENSCAGCLESQLQARWSSTSQEYCYLSSHSMQLCETKNRHQVYPRPGFDSHNRPRTVYTCLLNGN